MALGKVISVYGFLCLETMSVFVSILQYSKVNHMMYSLIMHVNEILSLLSQDRRGRHLSTNMYSGRADISSFSS